MIHRKHVFISVTILICGCSGGNDDSLPRAGVRGSVVVDGRPLEAGVVRFVPIRETKGPKTTVPVKAGLFEISAHLGPIVGSHQVEIVSTDDGGYLQDDEGALDRLRVSGTRRIDVVRVPAAYNTHSQLTAEVVEAGPNEFDFTLFSNTRRSR